MAGSRVVDVCDDCPIERTSSVKWCLSVSNRMVFHKCVSVPRRRWSNLIALHGVGGEHVYSFGVRVRMCQYRCMWDVVGLHRPLLFPPRQRDFMHVCH